MDRAGAVLQAHDLSIRRPGRDFQVVRQGLALDGQRVIARRRERRRQTRKDAFPLVQDRRGLAVHQGLGADHVSAERLTDGLMAQADAQNRHGCRRRLDQRQADAGLIRCAGTGRQQHGGGVQRPRLIHRQVVIAHHMRRRAQLREVVDEIVGEAVVVIDDEDHDLASRRDRPSRQACVALKRILTDGGV